MKCMIPASIQEVVLVGAGNVAWHLGHALESRGIRINQVISRNLSSCRELAERVGAMASDDLSAIDRDADACIFTVPDDVLPDVLGKAAPGKGIWLHTAGSVPMEVLEPFADHFGVLYPVQTFSKGRELDFNEIPLLVEASGSVELNALTEMAQKLSGRVAGADSATRCMVHMAAVFACNFTNHMYASAEILLSAIGHNLDLLEPLMCETMLKALEISPGKAQTGPALRGDLEVIRHHLELLQGHPELEQLYRVVSDSIMKRDKREEKLK